MVCWHFLYGLKVANEFLISLLVFFLPSWITLKRYSLSSRKTWPVIQSCSKTFESWTETKKKGGWANQGITIFVTLQRHSKQVWRPFYLLYSWRVWVTNHVQSWRPYRSKASIPLDHLKGVRAPDWKISKFYIPYPHNRPDKTNIQLGRYTLGWASPEF